MDADQEDDEMTTCICILNARRDKWVKQFQRKVKRKHRLKAGYSIM